MLNLDKLSELAKDNTAGGRKSLVSALTDLFLSAEPGQAEQISLIFGDIVMRVLGKLELETRMALAERVCSHSSAPHALMVELGKDQIEVAQAVLEKSPVLQSGDLSEIAKSGSMDHLSAIAGREQVDEEVTQTIVSHGDNQVLTKVVENQGAHFNEETFTRLASRAKDYPAIQEALMNRADLPADAARMLVPFLSDELTERVKELGADNALVQVMAEKAAQEVAARARKVSEARQHTDQLIRDVQSGKAKIDDAVRMFSRNDRAAELGILLAAVSELPAGSVSKLIYGKSDKPLVILCKANGVSTDAFKNILTMRARRMGMGGLAINEAMQRYETFSDTAAMESLAVIRNSVAGGSKKPEDDAAKTNIAFAVNR